MSIAVIAAIVVSALAGAAIVSYVVYQIVMAVRRSDPSMWINVLGARFYTNKTIAKESVVSDPLPGEDRLIAYLYPRIDSIRSAIKTYLPNRIIDASIAGAHVNWQPVRRVRKIAGGYKQDPQGEYLMFRDPSNRRPGRTHDWYAGRRTGNAIKVGWTGALPLTALLHELAHLMLDRNGLNPDAEHTRYPEVWRVAG